MIDGRINEEESSLALLICARPAARSQRSCRAPFRRTSERRRAARFRCGGAPLAGQPPGPSQSPFGSSSDDCQTGRR